MSNLTEAQARYADMIRARQKKVTVEHGYSCLCCRDTGVVTPGNIKRYELAQGEFGGFDEFFVADAMFLCQKPGCFGNSTEITVQSENGDYQKPAKKFSVHALRTSISVEVCAWVHEQELKRFREGGATPAIAQSQQQLRRVMQAPEQKNTDRGGSQLTSLGASLGSPSASPSDLTQDECQGFSVGDRVSITLHTFSKEEKRQIVREDGIPIGLSGSIVRFYLNTSALKRGDRLVMIRLLLDDDRELDMSLEYVTKVEAKAA